MRVLNFRIISYTTMFLSCEYGSVYEVVHVGRMNTSSCSSGAA